MKKSSDSLLISISENGNAVPHFVSKDGQAYIPDCSDYERWSPLLRRMLQTFFVV